MGIFDARIKAMSQVRRETDVRDILTSGEAEGLTLCAAVRDHLAFRLKKLDENLAKLEGLCEDAVLSSEIEKRRAAVLRVEKKLGVLDGLPVPDAALRDVSLDALDEMVDACLVEAGPFLAGIRAKLAATDAVRRLGGEAVETDAELPF